jgi:hypothetical protein
MTRGSVRGKAAAETDALFLGPSLCKAFACPQMSDQRTIRIFISSPADVRPERLKAEQIVARLDREFAYHFHVEALFWEREPLVAARHPQDPVHLPQPRRTDIVVVILWSS